MQREILFRGKRVDNDIMSDGNDIVVIANGKEVFRKPKTKQTVAIANDIYMYHKYSRRANNVRN